MKERGQGEREKETDKGKNNERAKGNLKTKINFLLN